MTSFQLWLGTVGMAVGTLPPLYTALTNERRRTRSLVLAAITGVAALAYLGMALGYGNLTVSGRPLYVLRYVDWVVTTPLMVLYLGLLCNPSRRIYAALVAADVVVIASGVAAVVIPGPVRFASYLVGCVAYVSLLYLLVYTLPRAASFPSPDAAAVFEKLRNLTAMLWTIYPAVWLLGPTGTGLLLPGTESLVVVYLDLISKVGFVVIAVNGASAFVDAQRHAVGEQAVGPADD
jgi:sensory rhodopsin